MAENIMSVKEIRDYKRDIESDPPYDGFIPYDIVCTTLKLAEIVKVSKGSQGMNCEHDDAGHTNAEDRMICAKCEEKFGKLLSELPPDFFEED